MAAIGSVKGGVLREALDLVFPHLAAERVAMHAEGACRLGEATVGADENPADEPLLEFPDGVLEANAPVDHLFDELLDPLGNHASRPLVTRAPARSSACMPRG